MFAIFTTMKIDSIPYSGRTFTKMKSGYYVANINGSNVYLHRFLYAEAHGEIPAGAVVHHIDGNKANNSLGNLTVMSIAKHQKHHVKLRHTENNTHLKAVQDFSWHRSDEGRAFYREQNKNNPELHRVYERDCAYCGKKVMKQRKSARVFCTQSHCVMFHRKMKREKPIFEEI